MAIWELIEAGVSQAHAEGREWLSGGEIVQVVQALEAGANAQTVRMETKFHCINDPSKRHSPGRSYRRNPLLVTDDPTLRGKRYRLLQDAERTRFRAAPRDDLERYSYTQLARWLLDGAELETSPDEEAAEGSEADAQGVEASGPALLERHLQDYLLRHWNAVFPELELWEGERGREFRTSDPSVGIIDFLCRDRHGDWVVIETKRDAPARAAVGQILSYMGWVRRRLCDAGQGVRGLLVVGEVTPELDVAVAAVPALELRRYEIRFALTDGAAQAEP